VFLPHYFMLGLVTICRDVTTG